MKKKKRNHDSSPGVEQTVNKRKRTSASAAAPPPAAVSAQQPPSLPSSLCGHSPFHGSHSSPHSSSSSFHRWAHNAHSLSQQPRRVGVIPAVPGGAVAGPPTCFHLSLLAPHSGNLHDSQPLFLSTTAATRHLAPYWRTTQQMRKVHPFRLQLLLP